MTDLSVRLRITGEGRDARAEVASVSSELKESGTAGRKAGDQIERGMTDAARGAGRARRNTDQVSRSLSQARTAALGFVGVLGARELLQGAGRILSISDSVANYEARLQLATDSQGEYNAALAEIPELADETFSSLQATAALYSRLEIATRDLDTAQQDVLGVTEVVNKTFQISGANAQEAASSTVQFAQGLAAGALRGDEFRSVMEQAPGLVRALADGLDVAQGELKDMADAGELTAERVIEALLSQRDIVDEQFADLPVTVGRAVQQLENAWTQYIAATDEGIGASAQVAESIQFAAENIDVLDQAIGVALNTLLIFAGSRGLRFAASGADRLAIQIAAVAEATRPLAGGIQQIQPGLFRVVQATTRWTRSLRLARRAGSRLFTLVGGWPTILAGAGVAFFQLQRSIDSQREAAEENIEVTDSLQDRIDRALGRSAELAEREQQRVIDSVEQQIEARRGLIEAIEDEIAAQERRQRVQTGPFGVTGDPSISGFDADAEREEIRRLRDEVQGLQEDLEALREQPAGEDQGDDGPPAAVKAFTAGLEEQIETLREQQVEAKGGAAALAELEAAQLDQSELTAEQRQTIVELIATLREEEQALADLKSATDDQSDADEERAGRIAELTEASAEAAEQAAEAEEELAQMVEQRAAQLAGPVAEAEQAHQERLARIAELERQLLAIGPQTQANLDRLNRAREQSAEQRDREVEAAEEQITTGEEAIEQLEAEIDALDEDTEAVESNTEVQRILNQIRDSGGQVTAEQVARIRELVAARQAERQSTAEAAEAEAEMARVLEFGVRDALFAVSELLTGTIEDFDEFGDVMKDIATRVVEDLIEQFLRLEVLKPILEGTFSGGSLLEGLATPGGSAFLGVLGGQLFDRPVSGAAGGLVGGGIGQAIGGPIGRVAGSIIGSVVGSVFGGLFDDKPFLQFGPVARGSGRERRDDAIVTTPFGQVGVGQDELGQETAQQFADAVQRLDETVASVLPAELEAAVADAMADAFARREGEFDPEELLQERFEQIVRAIDDELGLITERTVTQLVQVGSETIRRETEISVGVLRNFAVDANLSLEEQIQRLESALAINDLIEAGENIFGDLGLGATLTQTEALARGNETLTQTYTRLAAQTEAVEQLFNAVGADIGRTGQALVEFADAAAQAAGGVDAFRSRFQSVLQTFFDADELARIQLEQARPRAEQELADVGLAGDTGREQFREAFEEALNSDLAPEALAEWLEAGEALGVVIQLEEQLGETRLEQAKAAAEAERERAEFRRGIDQRLAELTEGEADNFRLQLQAINERFAEATAEARKLGASEQTLSKIRKIQQLEIDALAAELRASIGDLVQQLFGGGSDLQQSFNTGASAAGDFAASIDNLAGVMDRIRDVADSLLTDPSLSPLGPEGRVDELQSQLDEAISSGNFADVPGIAQDLARAIRESGASSAQADSQILALRERLLGLAPDIEAAQAAQAPPTSRQVGTIADGVREIADNTARQVGMAVDLVQQLALLAEITNRNPLAIAEELGVPLDRLVEVLGVNIAEPTADMVAQLGTLSEQLGVGLAELSEELGVQIGRLTDEESLLNNALEQAIGDLPPDIRGPLETALGKVETAASPEEQEKALEELEDLVGDLDTNFKDQLAPFFEGIDISTEAGAQLTQLELIEGNTADLAQAIRDIDFPSAGSEAEGSFATGGLIPRRMLIEAGEDGPEAILSTDTLAELQRIGIPVQPAAGSDGDEVEALLRRIAEGIERAEARGESVDRGLVGALSQLSDSVTSIRDEAKRDRLINTRSRGEPSCAR